MLLSRHFVFLHLWKTAGTFLKAVVIQNAPPEWECREIGGHPLLDEIPESHRRLPRYGIIRNPWDWYVSAYHYFTTHDHGSLFAQLSDNGRRDFAETLTAALDMEQFRAQGIGPLTHFAHRFYGLDSDPVTLLRFESLRDELIQVMLDLPVEAPEKLLAALRETPPINTSERTHYRDYYDDTLRERVAEADRGIIEAMGYRF